MSVKTASSHGKEGRMMRTCFINVGRDWLQYSVISFWCSRERPGRQGGSRRHTILPRFQTGFQSIQINLRGCPNRHPYLSGRVFKKILRRSAETRAVELGRNCSIPLFLELGQHLQQHAPQPCSYSIWPLTTFLSAIPFPSSYLHSTSLLEEESYLGCYWVPPFNENAHQVFQNYIGKM